MLHGVYTAYQHGLNRILLSSQAAMHVENTNCFPSTDGAAQPMLALRANHTRNNSLTTNCLPSNNCISPHYTRLITYHPCIMTRQVLHSSDVLASTTCSQQFFFFQRHINTCNSNQRRICGPIRFVGNTYRRLQFPPRLRNMHLYNIQPIQTSVQSLYIHHSLIKVRGELTSPDCLISGDLALCQR